jgi:single-stranded DNA-binding protein
MTIDPMPKPSGERGSVVTVCGEIASAPIYTQMSSGKPVLYYKVRCQNASGKGCLLRIVCYDKTASEDSRTLSASSHVFVTGYLQERDSAEGRITEIVRDGLTILSDAQRVALQSYGAQAALLGEIVEGPVFTFLGEQKTPFMKFMLRCANPKGNHAVVAVVHFGTLAATYAETLRCGMQVVVDSEIRSHYYYPNGRSRPVYVLQFVTDKVEVAGTVPERVVLQ